MNVPKLVRIAVALAVGCLVVAPAVLEAGNATPRKMDGTWTSVVAIPPNPVMGNTEMAYLPELDTFATAGTVMTSSAALVMPLRTDQGNFIAAVGVGQGNWRFQGGRFMMTQMRFLTGLTGQPIGYLKVRSEWRLANRNTGRGRYLVEMLHLDMRTPYTTGNQPIAVAGSFEMMRLPVQRMP